MVWLWTWSTIKNFMQDDEWIVNVTEDQMWDNLGEAVASGQGFSLEYGAEQHQDDVLEWMLNRDYIVDTMFEEDEEDEDEDEDKDE
jgi:hypothetical protein